MSSFALVRRMLSYLLPVWPTALIACLVVLLRVGLEVASVHFMSPAIEQVARLSHAGADDGALGRTLMLMAALQVGLGVAIYLRSVWEAKLSMRAVFHLRGAVFDRLQRVGFAFHDRMTSGQLINRALGDLQSVRAFVNLSLLGTVEIVLTIGGYFFLLFWRSPWLALAAAVPLPFWAVAIRRFGERARPAYLAQQEAADRLMSALSENIGGVHVVRAFGAEPREVEKYAVLNETLLGRAKRMIRLQSRLTPTLKAIATCAHIGLFVVASRLIEAGRLGVGDLMILGVAMTSILAKLQQVNAMADAYQKAVVSGRRLFEVLDEPVALADGRDARRETERPLSLSRGEVSFEGVTFGYDAARPVLRDVTLKLPGGEVVALIGPTGSGKSTLAALVGRFYEPQAGKIRIDGQDVSGVDLASLRREVGYVFQETFLFGDTIGNNIRYGRADVSDEMVARAARVARVDEFIERLPEGYDTRLGEGGVMLSGGQRQRLAIARALVYDPRVLILDDATAALDPETDEAVHAMLRTALAGRTVLVIAHRLATVKRADRIVVMSGGRVTHVGGHEELERCDGLYRDMVRLQRLQSDEVMGGIGA